MTVAPLVSVLLPVRDAEATLGAALHSVARQRGVAFECVVMDDGSTDASRAVAERRACTDARFRVVATEARGLVHALNAGLEACRGDFVARLDADDWMHRDRLALQLRALDAAPHLAGVGSHVRLFPRSALGEGMRAYERWLSGLRSAADVRRDAFVECPIAHPALFVRRAVLARHRYRDVGWPEDYDLVLRMLGAGDALGVVPRRLVGWRHTPGRLSQNHDAYSDARFTACKAHFLRRGFLARHERYRLWGFGGTGRALAKALRAEDRQLDAIVELHPGRLGQRIHGAPVIPPERLGPPGRLPLVVSVAGAEARTRIRGELARMGWREGADYLCAA